MTKWVTSIILMVGLLCILMSLGYAAPVEYVRVCDIYGAGFYFVPGTDICFNPKTGEAKIQTEGGTWSYPFTNTSGNWVQQPWFDCEFGKIVKVGTFTSANFVLNSYQRFQTQPFTLTLRPGEFISKVMIQGGLTGTSIFCLSFYDTSTEMYSPLGCVNPELLMEQPAAFSFTPIRSVPPSSFTSPFRLVGYNAEGVWGPPPEVGNPPTAVVNGSISCYVCIGYPYNWQW